MRIVDQTLELSIASVYRDSREITVHRNASNIAITIDEDRIERLKSWGLWKDLILLRGVVTRKGVDRNGYKRLKRQ